MIKGFWYVGHKRFGCVTSLVLIQYFTYVTATLLLEEGYQWFQVSSEHVYPPVMLSA